MANQKRGRSVSSAEPYFPLMQLNIFYNRIIIDAKSILGILSMDLTRDLTVQCYGDSNEFNKTLKKFAVA